MCEKWPCSEARSIARSRRRAMSSADPATGTGPAAATGPDRTKAATPTTHLNFFMAHSTVSKNRFQIFVDQQKLDPWNRAPRGITPSVNAFRGTGEVHGGNFTKLWTDNKVRSPEFVLGPRGALDGNCLVQRRNHVFRLKTRKIAGHVNRDNGVCAH